MIAILSSADTFSQNKTARDSSLFDSASAIIAETLYMAIFDSNGVVTYTNEQELKEHYLRKNKSVGVYGIDLKYAGYYILEGKRLRFIPAEKVIKAKNTP